jgi:hypothetical protein
MPQVEQELSFKFTETQSALRIQRRPLVKAAITVQRILPRPLRQRVRSYRSDTASAGPFSDNAAADVTHCFSSQVESGETGNLGKDR